MAERGQKVLFLTLIKYNKRPAGLSRVDSYSKIKIKHHHRHSRASENGLFEGEVVERPGLNRIFI
jgi:hypothetical protein